MSFPNQKWKNVCVKTLANSPKRVAMISLLPHMENYKLLFFLHKTVSD